MEHSRRQLVAVKIDHEAKVPIQLGLKDLRSTALDRTQDGTHVFVCPFKVIFDFSIPFQVLVAQLRAAFVIRDVDLNSRFPDHFVAVGDGSIIPS